MGLKVLPEYDILTIASGSATSSASNYPLTNAYTDYKKPWKTWRSTSLVAQTITLNFTGDTDCICLFNCNFENITIDGETFHLGYEPAIVEFRAMFFKNKTNSITFIIPAQTTLGGVSYYEMGSVAVGETTDLTKGIRLPYVKELIVPVKMSTLGSGQVTKRSGGKSHHVIIIRRDGVLSIRVLDEVRDVNRQIGKTDVIIFFENMGEVEKVFLCRRDDIFGYTENAGRGWTDIWRFIEIT